MGIVFGPKGVTITKDAPATKVEENKETATATPEAAEKGKKELALGNVHAYMYLEVELDGEARLGVQASKFSIMTQNNCVFFAQITDDEELKSQCVLEGDVWRVYGSKKTIAMQFNLWMNEFMSFGLAECVQIICNSAMYKFPAFIDVITNGEDIGKLQTWITPLCYDLKIDICNCVSMVTPEMAKYPLRSAFMIDNRAILYSFKGEDFVINTDDKVINDMIITAIIHRHIWGME